MDEMEFTEADSNLNDMVGDYCGCGSWWDDPDYGCGDDWGDEEEWG